MKLTLLAGALLVLPGWSQDPAKAPEETCCALQQAVLDGRWWLRLRYRVEYVDQEPFEREAWASTLRTVLGYETAAWHGMSALVEFENVTAIGNELYDSGINGMSQYPKVIDPEGSEVNQVHFKYAPCEALNVKLGRQVLIYDNHRFVGDVGWRQNQQTFDAATLTWQQIEQLDVSYAFVDNVNRVFGDDSPDGDHRMASHLVNAGYDFSGVGRLVAYAYLLDYDTVDANSTDTYGARFAGSPDLGAVDLLYSAEYAAQVDAGDNPNDVDQDYVLGELGVRVSGWTLKTGYEVLGGSGDTGDAFQTPLATLHSFNGWADKFLVTPNEGLKDAYLSAGGKAGDFDFQIAWHDFRSDADSLHYGTELDAIAAWNVAKAFTVGLKLARYDAEDLATDTTKAWLWVGYAP
jgi:hypothetical protein